MKKSSVSKYVVRFIKEFLLLALIGNGIVYFIMGYHEITIPVLLKNTLFSFIGGWPMLKSVAWLVQSLDKNVPWLVYPLKRLIYQSVGMILLCAFFILLAVGIAFIWHRTMEEIDIELFLSQVGLSLKIAFGFLILSSLVTNSVLFFKKWKDAAVEQERLKHEHTALQYETLKSQVNPHFLFNSLNALIQLIHTDADKAEAYVKKLSHVYRFVLDMKDKETVALKKELQAVEDYIFLLKIKYGDSLKVSFPDELPEGARIVPLSLQMLLENVVKHNVIARSKPVEVTIHLKNDYLIVKNNINEKTDKEHSTGIGLENISTRYRYLTNKTVTIHHEEGRFEVGLPLMSIIKKEE
nr:histidine kinase [uncultured Carboxylicivirga sp.]